MADPLPLSALSQLSVERPGLHQPGRDPCLRDVVYGGPQDPTDRRLILDTRTLRAMLEVAEASATGRVVIHSVGIRVRQHRAAGGHLYEIAYIEGRAPEAESSALMLAMREGALNIPGVE